MTDREKALDDLMEEDADLIGVDPDIEAAAPERIAVNFEWEDGCCPVEDMRDVLNDDVGKFFSRDEAVEYIRADLAKPRVKRLVWHSGDPAYGGQFSFTNVDCYSVVGGRSDQKWDIYLDMAPSDHGPFDTLEEAKAAAQADFERRVRECLE